MKNNLKNVKTFESFNETTSMYRGDFEKLKEFYANVILPACTGINPMSVVDTLVNDEYSDDEDMVQYFHDEFGIDYEKCKEIVSGRGLFLDQLFNPEDLEVNEKEILRDRKDGRVPNEGKGKVAENVKSKLKELRAMSDAELLKFLNSGMTPQALKRFMK